MNKCQARNAVPPGCQEVFNKSKLSRLLPRLVIHGVEVVERRRVFRNSFCETIIHAQCSPSYIFTRSDRRCLSCCRILQAGRVEYWEMVVTSFRMRVPHKTHEPRADGEIAQSPLRNVLNVLRVEEETTTTAGASG